MAPPIVIATLQSAVLAATSNFLAQAFMAHRKETPLTVDWVPMFQFVLFSLVSTPPNFLWQEFLESTYPAYVAAAAVPGGDDRKPLLKKDDGDDDAAAAAAGEQGGKAEEARLSTGNTAAKLALDQTVGAAVNTFLFSVFIHSIQAAMTTTTTTTTTASVGGGGGVNIDYGRVDWARVLARSRAEFAAMLVASWRLWPLVSLVNFTLVRTVEGRNLLGGLAGVGWGVYMSIFAAAAARS